MKSKPLTACRRFSGISRLSMAGMLGFILISTAPFVSAATVAQYTFTGSNGVSSDTDTDSVASDFTINAAWSVTTSTTYNTSSATFGSNAPVWQIGSADTGNGLTESISVAKGAYFSFTVTPNSGSTLSFTGLTFSAGTYASSGAGVTMHYFLRSSLDNYATTIGSIGTDTTGAVVSSDLKNLTSESMDLSGVTSLQNISSAITFRLYVADDRGNNVAVSYLDNVSLLAAVTVPEPNHLTVTGVMSVVGLGLWAVRRRRIRSV